MAHAWLAKHALVIFESGMHQWNVCQSQCMHGVTGGNNASRRYSARVHHLIRHERRPRRPLNKADLVVDALCRIA
jgi:hypothetical protein